MNRSLRIGTAVSAAALAGILAGCAGAQQQRQSIFGSKVDHDNIGLATKAQLALAAKDHAAAIGFAERAVQHSPNDAGFRAVLGNCYFAAGRFASAETAFRDALALHSQQPQVVLKLALTQIALGKNGQAMAHLQAARHHLEPADYGLAVALAGYPADAVAVLTQAARAPEADARVRQNLALAHALSGEWTLARTIAAQDLAPDQVGPRIQQWMVMAKPANAATQVAALTGVTPAADPGQPARLALRVQQPEQQLARAESVAVPPRPTPVVAAPAATAPAVPAYVPPPPPPVAAAEAPDDIREELAQLPRSVAPQVPTIAQAIEAPNFAAEPQPEAEPRPQPQLTRALFEASPAPVLHPAAAPVAKLPTRFEKRREIGNFVAISDKVRKAAARKASAPRRANGRANAVVQLGAYSSPRSVAAAWEQIAGRYGAVNGYTPVSARFTGPKGTVYRLSVKGFASAAEAQQLCSALQRKGKSCFVRRVAGDSPVQFAAR